MALVHRILFDWLAPPPESAALVHPAASPFPEALTLIASAPLDSTVGDARQGASAANYVDFDAFAKRAKLCASHELDAAYLSQLESAVKNTGFGPLAFLAATSSTAGDAAAHLSSGFALFQDSASFRREERRGATAYQLELADEVRNSRVLVEMLLLLFARILIDATGGSVRPLRVELEEPSLLVCQLLGSTPFGIEAARAPCPGLVFASSDLVKPLRFAHPRMHEFFRREVGEQLRHSAEPRNTLLELRRVLAQEGELNQECLHRASSQLGLSPRTLQRRLSAQGTTFKGELEKARQERALALVSEGNLSLEKIARKLGFADAPSFSRAFRRWFELPPGSFRGKSLRLADSQF